MARRYVGAPELRCQGGGERPDARCLRPVEFKYVGMVRGVHRRLFTCDQGHLFAVDQLLPDGTVPAGTAVYLVLAVKPEFGYPFKGRARSTHEA